MPKRCYLVPGTDPLEHMALENALLDGAWPSSACDPPISLLYVNAPSVIIGRNQNPWREVAESSSLPVYRRTSGGGTVYHDLGNLNWAIITRRTSHDQDAELATVARGISSLGVDVEPGPRGGIFVRSGIAAGKKVSGTARRFGREMMLHHGTLLVRADLGALRASLGGIETVDDRSVDSVKASPINLEGAAPGIEVEDAMAALAAAFEADFGGGAPIGDAGGGRLPPPLPEGYARAEDVEARRLALSTTEWIRGETPPFAIGATGDRGSARIDVRKGLVEAAAFEPAGHIDPALEAELAALAGKPFSYSMARAARSLAERAVLRYH